MFLLGSVGAAPYPFVYYPGYPYNIYNGVSQYQSTYYPAAGPSNLITIPQVSSAPVASYNGIIDIGTEVKKALNTPIIQDPRIQASIDHSSPTTAAALAYMREISKDGLCGSAAEIFILQILGGHSREVATAEATKSYLQAYNSGVRQTPEGPCEKAETAWRQAVVLGKDPVLEAALVFMNNWPGVIEGNPCAVSGVDYVKAILSGKSHLDATKVSIGSFARSFKQLAQSGQPLKDKACLESTKAFWNAIPSAQKTNEDNASAKAFLAFTDKIFNGNAPAYDPVCQATIDGFLDSYLAGDDLQTSYQKSARSFLSQLQNGNSRLPANSACIAATQAYSQELLKKPSASASAGMMAYINEILKNGEGKLDPLCGAAALAYWDAYIVTNSDAAASEAAAVAYLDALNQNPHFDHTSACAKAADAYIKTF